MNYSTDTLGIHYRSQNLFFMKSILLEWFIIYFISY